MPMLRPRLLWIALLLTGLLLACGTDDDNGNDANTDRADVPQRGTDIVLDATFTTTAAYSLRGAGTVRVGFRIDYPAAWHVEPVPTGVIIRSAAPDAVSAGGIDDDYVELQFQFRPYDSNIPALGELFDDAGGVDEGAVWLEEPRAVSLGGFEGLRAAYTALQFDATVYALEIADDAFVTVNVRNADGQRAAFRGLVERIIDTLQVANVTVEPEGL